MEMRSLAGLLAGATTVTTAVATWSAWLGTFDLDLWLGAALFAGLTGYAMTARQRVAQGLLCPACGRAQTFDLGSCLGCGVQPRWRGPDRPVG